MAAVLLIGNLFLIVGLLLVDSTVVRIGLLVAALAMLAGGVLILSRHAARLKAIHAAGAVRRDASEAVDADKAGTGGDQDDGVVP